MTRMLILEKLNGNGKVTDVIERIYRTRLRGHLEEHLFDVLRFGDIEVGRVLFNRGIRQQDLQRLRHISGLGNTAQQGKGAAWVFLRAKRSRDACRRLLR